MNTQFNFLGKSLTLYRYPKRFTHPSWQSWDSADELLIEHINFHPQYSAENEMLIFNDDFGALTTWFADHRIYHVSDSYVATRACLNNLRENDLGSENITLYRAGNPGE